MTPSNIRSGFRRTGIYPFDKFIFTDDDLVSRQLDAENWTRENWSLQPGRATIGRARQLDACDNWTRATIGRWTHATIFEVINFINSLLKVSIILCMLQLLGNILFFFRILLYLLGM
jgi:hypothetical protein